MNKNVERKDDEKMVKYEYLKGEYQNETVKVQIEEDEDAYLYAMKSGEEVGRCLSINVFDRTTKACLNTYWAELSIGGNMGTCHQFIKKFLNDPEFRESYRTDDKEAGWQGVISLEVEGKGIDQRCERQIERLNHMKEPKFKDFMGLKTFGRDKVSSMKRDVLLQVLVESDVDLICEKLEEEKQQTTAFRWVYRGLMPQLAIRKVLTDLEVAKNCY